jgi:predicted alpha/beta hydrolase family esterase
MRPRLLIVPGLGDSGPEHWQSHLERSYPDAERARQRDWHDPDLDAWVSVIGSHLESRHGPALVVAHSFGCLAAARAIRRHPRRAIAALLVAPADPERFGVGRRLPRAALGTPTVIVASDDDPWCRLDRARSLAQRWEAQLITLGGTGHINVDSGHGRWPFGERLAETLARVHGSLPRVAPRRVAPSIPAQRANP